STHMTVMVDSPRGTGRRVKRPGSRRRILHLCAASPAVLTRICGRVRVMRRRGFLNLGASVAQAPLYALGVVEAQSAVITSVRGNPCRFGSYKGETRGSRRSRPAGRYWSKYHNAFSRVNPYPVPNSM